MLSGNCHGLRHSWTRFADRTKNNMCLSYLWIDKNINIYQLSGPGKTTEKNQKEGHRATTLTLYPMPRELCKISFHTNFYIFSKNTTI